MEASMLIGLRIGLQGVFTGRIRVCYRDLFLQSQATSSKLREKSIHKLSCIFRGSDEGVASIAWIIIRVIIPFVVGEDNVRTHSYSPRTIASRAHDERS